MTPIIISKTGTGRSSVVVPDSFQNPFNVGLVLTVTGTVTFNVEVTMDDPMAKGFDPATAVWGVAPNLSGQTASSVASLTVPCHGISLNVTAGDGTISAQIVQAGVR